MAPNLLNKKIYSTTYVLKLSYDSFEAENKYLIHQSLKRAKAKSKELD
jgi:hypothetical protein